VSTFHSRTEAQTGSDKQCIITTIAFEILKLFQCFISHETTSKTEIKVFQNYCSNIEHELQQPLKYF